MCRQCILVGALFNAGKELKDCLKMENFGRHDFFVNEDIDQDFFDPEANAYLATTLKEFSGRGINLVAIKTDSDGSCLPHAISR